MTTTPMLLSMPAPSIEYGRLAPMLVVFGVAVAGVVVEAFAPQHRRRGIQLVLCGGGLASALIAVIAGAGTGGMAMAGAVAVDGPARFLQGTILVIGLLALLLIGERRATGGLDSFTPQASAVPGSTAQIEATQAGVTQTEVFPLTMFAVGGMLLLPAANDLLTMFIALEVFSLPLYLLCGLARRRRVLSQEAALKYLLLGAFSSAFFLYGVAMLYGYAGTLSLAGIGSAIAAGAGDGSLALVGMGLVSVGLLFKVGAVPFHSWIPDVYQGAPTPITGFMAAATKIAAFGAILRIFYVALPGLRDGWRPVLWGVAILTMVAGAVMVIAQTDIKRMLAYSAIAQAGFILVGVVAANGAGLSSTLFYLVAYGLATLGAFAVITLVRAAGGEEDTELARWAGLGRRVPLLGAVFTIFLLAFAGIPLTSGFIAKLAVFKAAGEGGAMPLVVVGVIASAIAAFVYLRVIIVMYSPVPERDGPQVLVPGAMTRAAILVGATGTVLFGIMPQFLLDLAGGTGMFLLR
ncbi:MULTISPECIES: NADH-quinone oxidoreductase subunit NuoN [Mycolicibacterium]|uniref:NADH-quinone oxidoreductase subunit NuoN n=1 Tax=Mycolicibacterium TaxID=1866885 RepID=UPI0007ECE318|nr:MULTISPECIES: NADH-quinone oxidoreductase subunit NuoN [Mycolicibacterium]OBK06601.1 NADH-quinone oxidoreductase subunit N [Mycolicibacterium fortuitum]UBV17267.1 NADH-quinone oxidoreductase subunit NuoN [Mycolicibacterium fortuitum]